MTDGGGTGHTRVPARRGALSACGTKACAPPEPIRAGGTPLTRPSRRLWSAALPRPRRPARTSKGVTRRFQTPQLRCACDCVSRPYPGCNLSRRSGAAALRWQRRLAQRHYAGWFVSRAPRTALARLYARHCALPQRGSGCDLLATGCVASSAVACAARVRRARP